MNFQIGFSSRIYSV